MRGPRLSKPIQIVMHCCRQAGREHRGRELPKLSGTAMQDGQLATSRRSRTCFAMFISQLSSKGPKVTAIGSWVYILDRFSLRTILIICYSDDGSCHWHISLPEQCYELRCCNDKVLGPRPSICIPY